MDERGIFVNLRKAAETYSAFFFLTWGRDRGIFLLSYAALVSPIRRPCLLLLLQHASCCAGRRNLLTCFADSAKKQLRISLETHAYGFDTLGPYVGFLLLLDLTAISLMILLSNAIPLDPAFVAAPGCCSH